MKKTLIVITDNPVPSDFEHALSECYSEKVLFKERQFILAGSARGGEKTSLFHSRHKSEDVIDFIPVMRSKSRAFMHLPKVQAEIPTVDRKEYKWKNNGKWCNQKKRRKLFRNNQHLKRK